MSDEIHTGIKTLSNYTDSLDSFFILTQHLGSLSKSNTNILYNVNNPDARSLITPNKDNYGLAFFTRPQLNMTAGNLRNERKLIDYLTTNEKSVLMYAKNVLDPRIYHNSTELGKDCPLLDNLTAFIPVFTNTLFSMSGWPDPVTPDYTSDKGVRGEQWSIVDGTSDIYEAFDITCNFKNMQNEPITHILNLWTKYMELTFEGILMPYLDFITENEIDYNTRIYRLVLDETKVYVKKIACTGAAYPTVNPLGKFFDYTESELYNSQTKNIDVRFKCLGACYNDPIVVHEFNTVVGIFNPEMRALYRGENHNMDKVTLSSLSALNYRAYPLINTKNMELEWWISKNSKRYKLLMNHIKSIGNLKYNDITYQQAVEEAKKKYQYDESSVLRV